MNEALQQALNAVGKNDRVWIYAAGRKLNATETQSILDSGARFCASWDAHGKGLKAMVQVVADFFVLLQVDQDEALATGCSIDKSVQWIQHLGQSLGIDFLDRMQLAWLGAEGTLMHCKMHEINQHIAAGNLSADMPVFDNTLSLGADVLQRWLVPARKTWVARYFPASVLG